MNDWEDGYQAAMEEELAIYGDRAFHDDDALQEALEDNKNLREKIENLKSIVNQQGAQLVSLFNESQENEREIETIKEIAAQRWEMNQELTDSLNEKDAQIQSMERTQAFHVASRNATIKEQEKTIAELQAQVDRLRFDIAYHQPAKRNSNPDRELLLALADYVINTGSYRLDTQPIEILRRAVEEQR